MQVVRKIGKHSIKVDCNSGYGLELDRTLLEDSPQTLASGRLTRKQLLQKLSSGDEYYPIAVHWELLDKCNLACPFCYIVGHSNNRVVRFNSIRHHLSDLIDAGLLFCTLTGGEATIHPDFVEIYRYLKNNGVLVDLFTNGLMLSDEIVNVLQLQKPMSVEVSIYTLDDEVLRREFGAKIDHPAQAVLNNILRLKAVGINVSCKTLSTTLTANQLGQISDWCLRHKIDHESSNKIVGTHDGKSMNHFSMPMSPPASNSNAHNLTEHVALACGTRNYGGALDSSFALYPCPSIRHRDAYFDVRTLGLAEALRKMKTYIRDHQDLKIVSNGSAPITARQCLATAKPVKSSSGRTIFLTAV